MGRKKNFNTKYSAEFKLSVIMDMRENHLGYREIMRKYFPYLTVKNYSFLKRWERIYIEEGAAGLMVERRGRKSTGRPKKKQLDKAVEKDLIAENQRLRERNEYLEAELAYIKKLDALVRKREQRNGKKPV